MRRLHGPGSRLVGELPAEPLETFPQAAVPALERPGGCAALDRGTATRLGGADRVGPAAVVRLLAGGRA